jgi:hypothetical protein
MLFAINDRLSLSLPMLGVSHGFSKSFPLSTPEDAIHFELVVTALSVGGDPGMLAVLEATDDDQNWVAVLSVPLLSITEGLHFLDVYGLPDRTYRVHYIFGSASTASNCVISANVSTAHA